MSPQATQVAKSTITELTDEIQYLWELHKVDHIFQNAFLKSISGLQPTIVIQMLAKEIDCLYKEKSNIQHLLLSILKREEKLRDMQEMNNLLKEKAEDNETLEKVNNYKF